MVQRLRKHVMSVLRVLCFVMGRSKRDLMMEAGVAMVIKAIVIIIVVNGDLLDFIEVMRVMMRIRLGHVSWVCMVVCTFLNDIVLRWLSHCEVLLLVLLVLIMIRVVLVAVCKL